LVELANGWADELGMTFDELSAYSGDLNRLSDAFNVALDDFPNVLIE